MPRALEDFIRALRAVDVRVSPAEAIDAARAAATVGYADRQLFKDALCVTLAKSPDEVVRFDQTFGQRMIGTGDLSLETAGETSRIVMPSIDRPREVAEHILELSRALRGKQ